MNRDEAIRKRLAEELSKLPYRNYEICSKLGCDLSLIRKYKTGAHLPGAFNLSIMYELGMDVIYVLTGERTR